MFEGPLARGVVTGEVESAASPLPRTGGGKVVDNDGTVCDAASLFSTVSFNFCRWASSRLISSSMRLEKR